MDNGKITEKTEDTTAEKAEYCYNEYPISYYITACNADPECSYYVNAYGQKNCYDPYSDYQCCATSNTAISTFAASINTIYIPFYIFLAINTFRLFILTFALSIVSIRRAKPSLYTINPDTNRVKLQCYMNYLADHPASYIVHVFYCDAGKAITEGIIYNIAFPSAKFLYLNIILLYIPFFVFISIITNSQIVILNAVPTAVSTESKSTTINLLIVCIIGLIIMFIGFIMNVYRWRKKNQIERINVENKADSLNQRIISGDQSNNNHVLCCGFIEIEEYKRKPTKLPKKLNLIFRWINLIIFIYLWILVLVHLLEYGYVDDNYYIAYIVFLCFNTMRLMIITVWGGISLVDNEYNYIINEKTGKVKLRYFMDYLCDHPAGFIVGLLYPDVNKALHEGLLYNITFPAQRFLFANILIFYVPMLILSSIQASHISMHPALYIIASIACGIGIVSNGYRFKQKNEAEN